MRHHEVAVSALSITVACNDYDRVRPILDGRVSIEGCDVNFISLGPEEVFFRAFGAAEFDVSELSLSSYLMSVARAEADYVAVPAFVSRMFRHSAIYIRSDRGIATPEDLRGREVGVPEYQVTAALWVRGLLQDEYGVASSEIRWRTGGIEEPGRYEKLALELPPEIEVKPIAAEMALGPMLAGGEIDALVAPRAPRCFVAGTPGVGRLFPDYRQAERDYFAKTALFPIMHVVGVRRTLLERQPWLAASVYKAFLRAKAAAVAELANSTALHATLPWLAAELEQTRSLMGDDYWPYGVEANRTALEALTRYSFQQGLTPRQLAIEELFAPSTLDHFKI